jgi:hypothetical protein
VAIDELKRRFDAYLTAIAKGKDPRKIRIVLEQTMRALSEIREVLNELDNRALNTI